MPKVKVRVKKPGSISPTPRRADAVNASDGQSEITAPEQKTEVVSKPTLIKKKLSATNLTKKNPLQRQTSTSSQLNAQNEKIKELRDKTIHRENWNFFVDEEENKTNFFLGFQNQFTNIQYSKYLIASSLYSLKLLLIVMTTLMFIIKDGYQSHKVNFLILIIELLVIPLVNTTQMTKTVLPTTLKSYLFEIVNDPKKIVLIINLVPFNLSYKCLFKYQSYQVAVSQQEQNNQGLEQKESSSTVQDLALQSQLLALIMHNACYLLVNVFCMSSWTQYLTSYCIQLLIQISVFYLYNQDLHLDVFGLLSRNTIPIIIGVFLFALNEKIRKEQYVINHTNSQTKKQMTKTFNTSGAAKIILSKDGHIQMFNEGFETLLKDTFKLRSIPTNLLKFLQNDPDSMNQLKNILNSFKGSKDSKKIEFEMVFNKGLIQNPKQEDKSVKSEEKPADDKPAEPKVIIETNLSNDKNELYENKYAAFSVQVDQIKFKNSNSYLMHMKPIDNLKSKVRQLGLHTNIISQIIIANQKRIELLHRSLIQDKQVELQDMIGEFLGNSQVSLNMLQQLIFYLHNISNISENKTENYLLSEEIDFCLDGLTASKWEKEVQVFVTKGELPRKVNGDLTKFRNAFRTLLQFGIKYNYDNLLNIKCEFKSLTTKQQFLIQISLVMSKNPHINLDPLEIMFGDQEEIPYHTDMFYDEKIRKNQKLFFDHIREFGIGMLVFTSMVKQLQGEAFIHGYTNETFSKNETITGDQNQIKVGFKIPFIQACPDSKMSQSDNYKIQQMQKGDGKVQVYKVHKTPQIQTKSRYIQPGKLQGLRNLMQNQGIIETQKQSFNMQPQIQTIIESKNENQQSADNKENEFRSRMIIDTIKDLNQSEKSYNKSQDFDKITNSNRDKNGKKQAQNSESASGADKQGSNTPKSSQQMPKNKSSSNSLLSQIEQKRNNLMETTKKEANGKGVFDFQQQANQKKAGKDNNYASNKDVVSSKMLQDYGQVFSFMETKDDIKTNMGNRDKGSATVSIQKPNGDQTLSTMKSDTVKTINPRFLNNDLSDNDDVKVRDTLEPDEKQNKQSAEQLLSNSLKGDATILGLNQEIKNTNTVSNGSIDAPYNQLDSFMVDDDLMKTVSSQGYKQIFKENIKNDSFTQLQKSLWSYRKNLKKQFLSDFLKIQIFDRFNEVNGASRNLLVNPNDSKSSQAPSKPQDDDQNSQQKNSVIKEESHESTPTEENNKQVKSDKELNIKIGSPAVDLQGNPILTRIRNKPPANVFIKQLKYKPNSYKNSYFKHFKTQEMVQSQIKFKRTLDNQSYLDCVIENSDLLVQKTKKDKKIKESTTYATIWVKNIVLHPVDLNREYNCVDKYTTLRILPEVFDQVEQYEHPKADKSDSSQKPKNNVVATVPNSMSPNANHQHNSSPSSFNGERIGKQKLLLVEDSDFVVNTIKMLLTQCKVEYEICLDGLKACEKFDEYLKEGKMFDIVLMDLYMPIMDGYNAAQKMRELETKYNINPKDRHFICGHSSEASRYVEIKCLKSGMDDIVAKPMTAKTLAKMLSEHDRRKIKDPVKVSSHQLSNRNNQSPIQDMKNPILSPLKYPNQNFTPQSLTRSKAQLKPYFQPPPNGTPNSQAEHSGSHTSNGKGNLLPSALLQFVNNERQNQNTNEETGQE